MSNKAYTPPNQGEVRSIMARLNISPDKFNELTGVNPKVVRQYMFSNTRILYPVLYTLISKHTSINISQSNWRNEIGDYLDERETLDTEIAMEHQANETLYHSQQ